MATDEDHVGAGGGAAIGGASPVADQTAPAPETKSQNGESASFHQWKLKRRIAHGPFDNQHWLKALEGLTFPTECYPLPLETAKAMLSLYQHRHNGRIPPSAQDIATVAVTEGIIHTLIEKVGGEAFVRLSSRSPKDACGVDKDLFVKQLAKQRKLMATARAHAGVSGAGIVASTTDPTLGKPDVFETNARMCALAAAGMPGLRVTTGKAAMELLLNSERVFTDLLEATEAAEVYDTQIIVRQWDSRVEDSFEFRGFVHDNQLTAISQYNHYVYLPEVVCRAEALRNLMTEYWANSVRPRLTQVRNYVIDFAVLHGRALPRATDGPDDSSASDVDDDDTKAPSVLVIELNPFQSTTGPALFHWKRDADILAHGYVVSDTEICPPSTTNSTNGHSVNTEENKELAGNVAAPDAAASTVVPEFRVHQKPVTGLDDVVEYAMEVAAIIPHELKPQKARAKKRCAVM